MLTFLSDVVKAVLVIIVCFTIGFRNIHDGFIVDRPESAFYYTEDVFNI